jgi:GPH family glycoside/pentoside/hexuronide:cation symporter
LNDGREIPDSTGATLGGADAISGSGGATVGRPEGTPIPEDPRLTVARKTIYGTGDFTVNTALASLSLVYAGYFLLQYAELPPVLAGLIPLIGRTVDAVTDPLMGRFSDHVRWRAGRRRPFFLIGAVPFGASFALLWAPAPFEAIEARFAYYTFWYVMLSLSMTVLSVPYLALIPEMARTYDGRTSMNVFRNAGSLMGMFGAIAIRPIATAVGGGEATPESFALTAVGYGVVMAIPWLFIYATTWEQPEYQTRKSELRLVEGIRVLMRHKAYMQLMSLYLASRIAMDLIGVVLILYFTHVLLRSEDFEIMMTIFLVSVIAALPFWLAVSRHMDKARVFMIGAIGWAVTNMIFLFAQPDWPRWLVLAFAPLVAVGYAVADLMPWAMVGDVVDEDDLETGERREGIYNGFFTFLRKLGGALGVAGAMFVLQVAGLPEGRDVEVPDSAVTAIRWMASIGTSVLVLLAAFIARGYPLTRERHAEILLALEARDSAGPR